MNTGSWLASLPLCVALLLRLQVKLSPRELRGSQLWSDPTSGHWVDYNKKPARTCSLEGDEESVLKRQKSREIKHCENRLHPPDLSLRFRADPSSQSEHAAARNPADKSANCAWTSGSNRYTYSHFLSQQTWKCYLLINLILKVFILFYLLDLKYIYIILFIHLGLFVQEAFMCS